MAFEFAGRLAAKSCPRRFRQKLPTEHAKYKPNLHNVPEKSKFHSVLRLAFTSWMATLLRPDEKDV
jgi:hypothetical protein